ncbi:GCN5-related N-acetyltransferase [Fibrella aestuarina BUZ 2]|uniref:GCN5-related N-acetyltransferase n=1 Tax=Fibrella aestuarina BUZ 2 TaxID=1166018 RepID=I0KE24_9BACT|nr:GCN5-related N-acetyltransferase [Fibrella aestuarina BUZ 2]
MTHLIGAAWAIASTDQTTFVKLRYLLTYFQLDTCLLRPWREGDEEALSRHASNRNIWNWVRDFFPYPYTVRDATSWVRSNKTLQLPNNLAIEIDGEAVGNVGYTVRDDLYRYNAEIGYWLSEAYWGRGIISEVLPVMVEYIFRNSQVNRIYACVLDGNLGSMRVLERAHFRHEAVLLQGAIKNNKYLDEHIYAILREEFDAQQKQRG